MAIDFRIRDFCYPVSIWKLKKFLDYSQRADPQIFRDYQEERLGAIIEHAYKNVPYYRRLFDSLKLRPSDIRGVEDLKKLPVLTKEQVRKNLNELTARNAWRFLLRPYRTTGSTGTPLTIYHDKSSNVLEFATYWWHWNWAGYGLGDKFLTIRLVPFRLRPRLRGKLWHYDPLGRCLYLSALRFNPKEVELYTERIRRFQPKFLKVRPPLLYLFANSLKERGIRDLRFKAIFTGGMNLLGRDIKLSSEVFNSKVYDSYGLMERVANIRQCEHGSYHVNQACGIVEVLDEKGDPVSPGKKGWIVGTGLHNWAMPLIRYETRDLCVPEPAFACPCGRTLPVVRSIYGFMEDPVVTPDGRSLIGLGRVFDVTSGIRMGQVVQTRRDRIEVRVVRDVSYREQDGRAILENLRGHVGEDMDLRLVPVEYIEPTEEGKFKCVRSEIC